MTVTARRPRRQPDRRHAHRHGGRRDGAGGDRRLAARRRGVRARRGRARRLLVRRRAGRLRPRHLRRPRRGRRGGGHRLARRAHLHGRGPPTRPATWASRNATYTVVDATPPTITLTTPAAGAVYALGEPVAADYACATRRAARASRPVPAPWPTARRGHLERPARRPSRWRRPTTRGTRVRDGALHGGGPDARRRSPDRPADGRGLRARRAGASRRTRARTRRAARASPTCEGSVANGAAIDTSTVGRYVVRGAHRGRRREQRLEDRRATESSTTSTASSGRSRTRRREPLEGRRAGADPLLARRRPGPGPEAAGYPRPMAAERRAETPSGARAGEEEAGVRYERRAGRYSFLWKTERRWAGSCRQFVLKLDDGSLHRRASSSRGAGRRDRRRREAERLTRVARTR